MSAQIDVALSYDKICDDWEKFRNSTKINKCIVDFCDFIPPEGKILDVGCGTGYPIAQYLTERNFCVTGIDISRNMIDKANKLRLKNAVFIQKDVLDFSTDECYDGVIAFDSIWHIAKDKQADAYKKIASLMKSGGYFLFTHGNCDNETAGDMFNQKFYYAAMNTDRLKAVFSEAGLEIVSLTENYKEQSTGERDLLVVARKI